MRSRLTLLFVVCLSSLAYADTDYFPLAVGMEWTRDITKILPAGETFTGAVRDKVVGTIKKDGHEYTQIDQTIAWISEDKSLGIENRSQSKFVRKTTKGYFRGNWPESSGETLLYRLPFRNGATWESEWMNRPLKTKVLISSIPGFTVTVGGQTYTDCVRVRSDSPLPMFADYWLAPNVGVVQEIETLPDHTKTFITLKSFNAGK